MTRTIAIGIILATSGLVVAVLLVVLALIARDGGPADGWEADGLDELYDQDDGYERRTLAADWAEQLTPPEVPQLDLRWPRPYVPYVPRHADDTIEFYRKPDGWLPTIGAARIAATLDATEQIEAVTR